MVPAFESITAIRDCTAQERSAASCVSRSSRMPSSALCSVCLRLVPLLEVGLYLARLLLLLRIALPGLIRLGMRTPVVLLPGIVGGPFLAHRVSFFHETPKRREHRNRS